MRKELCNEILKEIRGVVDGLYYALKDRCSTLGELESEIRIVSKDFFWLNSDLGNYIREELERRCRKERGDFLLNKPPQQLD